MEKFTAQEKKYIAKAMKIEQEKDVRIYPCMKHELTGYVQQLAILPQDSDEYNLYVRTIKDMLENFWITYIEKGKLAAFAKHKKMLKKRKEERDKKFEKAKKEQEKKVLKWLQDEE